MEGWKDVLYECRKVAEMLEQMKEQRTVYKSLAEKCTTRYSFAPVHTSDDVNKVAAVHRLIALDKTINNTQYIQKHLQEEATMILNAVMDKRLRKILERRYVKAWSWKVIAEVMTYENDKVTTRHLLRLHAKAMTELEAYFMNELKEVM